MATPYSLQSTVPQSHDPRLKLFRRSTVAGSIRHGQCHMQPKQGPEDLTVQPHMMSPYAVVSMLPNPSWARGCLYKEALTPSLSLSNPTCKPTPGILVCSTFLESFRVWFSAQDWTSRR